MKPADAMKVINNRRFFVAVQQRLAEHERTVRRLVKEVERQTAKRHEPWADIEPQVRAELTRRHPGEYHFVRRSLDPYGVEFAGRALDPRWRHDSRRWGEVRLTVMSALADGTWRTTALPTQRAEEPATALEALTVAERNAELRRRVLAGELSAKAAQRKREQDNRRRRVARP
jgi:hypothetical protein